MTMIGALLLSSALATALPAPEVPALYRIQEVALSPSYSCQGDNFNGYRGPALFLTAESRRRNAPVLVFNGACGSEDEFDVALAGDDMSLIADLGENVPLQKVDAARAFNLLRVHRDDAYSSFRQVARAVAGHTYAILLNSSERRGLIVFHVVSLAHNASASIRYAVLSYEVLRPEVIAEGFSWERSAAACAE